MEFVVYRASNGIAETRNINTLEELLAFSDEVCAELIIGGTTDDEFELPTLMIYDDYIE
jgi:hypothetical protein